MTAHSAFMVLCVKKKTQMCGMVPTFVRSLKNRLVVGGGGRPVLLGQRNRRRMCRGGVAMGVAVLLVVDGLELCSIIETCLLGRGGKGLPQRTAGVEVRAPSASVVPSRARAHQTRRRYCC
ncbi:unnamed protein product [Leuciscus chuanchicus]